MQVRETRFLVSFAYLRSKEEVSFMVTWSVVGASSPLSEFFASGLSPDYDSANFAAVCFVASLCSAGDALYYVEIGLENSFVISTADACDFVLRTLQVLEAFWQLRDAGRCDGGQSR